MSPEAEAVWRPPVAVTPRRRMTLALGAGLLALAYLLYAAGHYVALKDRYLRERPQVLRGTEGLDP